MIHPGLVSVTFRRLDIVEVLDLCVANDLEGIEWGGDVHVPHGDLETARRVAGLTADAGRQVAASGSYYRAGADEGPTWPDVLETASALGAPAIRVWAGKGGSSPADEHARRAVTDDLLTIAESAGERGIAVATEYHAETLTDTLDSTLRLLAETDHRNLRTYWQPPRGIGTEDCLEQIAALSDRLSNVHVTCPSARGGFESLIAWEARWRRWLDAVAAIEGDRWAMIEFVQGGEPSRLPADAEALRAILADPHGN
jgi:sugar phosphate isomerase/epimerase